MSSLSPRAPRPASKQFRNESTRIMRVSMLCLLKISDPKIQLATGALPVRLFHNPQRIERIDGCTPSSCRTIFWTPKKTPGPHGQPGYQYACSACSKKLPAVKREERGFPPA